MRGRNNNMSRVKKVKVGSEMAYRLVHPVHTVLVTCASKAGKANIITLAWIMPTLAKPPMVAIRSHHDAVCTS